MDSSTVRVRPLRFAFLVEPSDKASLKIVFETNSALWGGIFNFIIPLFKSVPARYRQPYQKTINAIQMTRGLIEAFQPDFLVETKPRQAEDLGFSKHRVIPLQRLFGLDPPNKRLLGVDLRSVCDHLYETTFQFVLRHPPEVVIPASKNNRFELFFAAVFGFLPPTGGLKDVTNAYLTLLEGKREVVGPTDFPRFFDDKYLYPLRLTAHDLETRRGDHAVDGTMFYIDESSPYDLIDFWNLRALGWPISPLPASLAPQLLDYCEAFIADAYQPFPAPSNAHHFATFMCSPNLLERMQAFVSQLQRPDPQSVALDGHLPRFWEEWGQGADNARPQTITSKTQIVNSRVLNDALDVEGIVPEFLEQDNFCSLTAACANVLEDVPKGAPVIPWKSNAMAPLLHDFGQEKSWASREGIVFTAGRFTGSCLLRRPTAFNVFAAYFKTSGYEISLSPAGRTCEQIIAALGGIRMLDIVARSSELLRLLDRMAGENVEVEVDNHDETTTKRRFVRKPYAPLSALLEVLHRIYGNRDRTVKEHLGALVAHNVLKLGMSLRCTECLHTSWVGLEDVAHKLQCPRCSIQFAFPAGSPPKDSWAYKVTGPFAAENYAHGSYCVAATIRFLSTVVFRRTTWLPSIHLKGDKSNNLEADFGLFATPGKRSHETTPYLIFGECKSFNHFDLADFARARSLANKFPGAVLCFATLNQSFTPREVKQLERLVIAGRGRLDVGKIKNPVLVLTGAELFGQFEMGGPHDSHDTKSERARRIIMSGSIREICDLTQQNHLTIKPYHKWRQEAQQRKLLKKQARRKP